MRCDIHPAHYADNCIACRDDFEKDRLKELAALENVQHCEVADLAEKIYIKFCENIDMESGAPEALADAAFIWAEAFIAVKSRRSKASSQ